jgi:hypothetical protein
MADLLSLHRNGRTALGLALAFTLAGCSSRALRRVGPDAAGAGDTDVPRPISVDAGLPDARVLPDAFPPDVRGYPDAFPPDAPVSPDAWSSGGPDAPWAGAGAAEVGSPLADFCAGNDGKIRYQGTSAVVPVTTKTGEPNAQCCAPLEVRVHAQEAIGDDIDIALRIWTLLAAGTYAVGADSKEIFASLHRSEERPYLQRLMDSTLVGTVTLAGALDDPSQAWQLGLCVSLDASSMRYPGMLIYVPAARVAPQGWASRFRMWRLKDAALTGQDVDRVDINTLALASEPLIDLMDIDFVELESKRCEFGTCTWMGLNTDFQLGEELRKKIGSPVTLSGVPFVLEADGERIYLGAFETPISSYAIHGPEVMENEISDEGFPIYPPANYLPKPPDPRNDPRIVKVLSEAGKIAP